MPGKIRVGIGGWTYAPWRGVFYPPKLSQKKELEFAASHLTSIEINGTYYSTFKPASWIKWREETPKGFVFAVKASRYCTNRRVLAEGGESVDRFIAQGLSELGDKAGEHGEYWKFGCWFYDKETDSEVLVRAEPGADPRSGTGAITLHARGTGAKDFPKAPCKAGIMVNVRFPT